MRPSLVPKGKTDEIPGGVAVVSSVNDVSKQSLTQSMLDLIASMVKALVDYPDEVTVQASVEPEGTALLLRVAQTDLGKVIGKQGRTARSMRTILGAASMKAQHRFSLDIQQVGRPGESITEAPQ
jgi:predicted RNA-binding protein YlqC (UPF0109 family)